MAGLRLGWSLDLGYAVVQSDVAAQSHEAARVFETLGHDFADHAAPLPPLRRRRT